MPQSSAQRRRTASLAELARLKPVPYAPDVQSQTINSEGRLVARLQPDVYNHFEKSILGAVSQVPKDGIEAAWIAGAEFVLRKLRSEIVTG